MKNERRQALAREALKGSAHGADAPLRATARALELAELADTVVLVEGISDQAALETLARRHGRDLVADQVAIVPIGGAHAVAHYVSRFGPRGADLRVVGMCDVGEEDYFRKGLALGGLGAPTSSSALEQLGLFVCVRDLEDELIRAAGQTLFEAILRSQGDLGSFRTLQKQPQWRNERFEAQIRRWLGAGARRKTRYARLVVAELDLERVPRPLQGVLAAC